jgi:hypothetical protein
VPEKIKLFESVEAWQARARELFGDNFLDWRFVCPICGNVASVREFKEAGCPTPNSSYQECVGRWLPKDRTKSAFKGDGKVKKPCDYAGYGLIRVSPVRVVTPDGELHAFSFDGDTNA